MMRWEAGVLGFVPYCTQLYCILRVVRHLFCTTVTPKPRTAWGQKFDVFYYNCMVWLVIYL